MEADDGASADSRGWPSWATSPAATPSSSGWAARWPSGWSIGRSATCTPGPDSSARDRELIIVAVPDRDSARCDPQVAAHIQRAARDRRALGGDRGDDPSDNPVRRRSARDQCAQGAADGGRSMRAVRYHGRRRAPGIGRLDDRPVVDAGPAAARGLRALARDLAERSRPADGDGSRSGDVTAAAPDRAAQDHGDRPQLPRPRGGVGARHPATCRWCSPSGRSR